MRYKLVFDRRYKVSGRYPVNVRGKVVVFQDGVAYVSDKDTADYAKKLRYIAVVEEVPSSVPVVVETKLPEEVKPTITESIEEVKEALNEIVEALEEEEGSLNAIVDAIEESAPPTAEKISALYEELGTWSAVASSLEMTTAQLRKLREELGLL